jgi:hypothetical protein
MRDFLIKLLPFYDILLKVIHRFTLIDNSKFRPSREILSTTSRIQAFYVSRETNLYQKNLVECFPWNIF